MLIHAREAKRSPQKEDPVHHASFGIATSHKLKDATFVEHTAHSHRDFFTDHDSVTSGDAFESSTLIPPALLSWRGGSVPRLLSILSVPVVAGRVALVAFLAKDEGADPVGQLLRFNRLRGAIDIVQYT